LIPRRIGIRMETRNVTRSLFFLQNRRARPVR
jgi:hypothetical protein